MKKAQLENRRCRIELKIMKEMDTIKDRNIFYGKLSEETRKVIKKFIRMEEIRNSYHNCVIDFLRHRKQLRYGRVINVK